MSQSEIGSPGLNLILGEMRPWAGTSTLVFAFAFAVSNAVLNTFRALFAILSEEALDLSQLINSDNRLVVMLKRASVPLFTSSVLVVKQL